MSKLKINIGSGFKRYDGFLNVDYDKDCNPDYVVDLEKEKLPFEDNSVDEIRAAHILEHLGEGYFHVLKEMYRVCENGAIIDIVVPHHRHEYFLNDPTHKRPITVDGLRLFSKSYNNYCIEINDGSSKLGNFFDVDFEIIDYKYQYSPNYQGLLDLIEKDPSQKVVLEQIVSECNNVIVETYIKLMVVK